MDQFISGLVTFLLMPLQLVLIPIDLLLGQINGIEMIPSALHSIVSFIGTIPQTLVSLFGIHPLIWNAIFLVFVLYIGLAPAVNGIKKVWAWVRP